MAETNDFPFFQKLSNAYKHLTKGSNGRLFNQTGFIAKEPFLQVGGSDRSV